MAISAEEVFLDVQRHCMSKPGCTEDYPWGDVAWKVKGKGFAFGGQGSNSFTVKSTLEKQSILTLHPQITVAAYVGRHGWVTIEVIDDDTLSLAKDLVDESFEMVSRRKAKP